MAHISNADRELIDFSFMYSRECDLACSFCMYNSSPAAKDRVDLDKLNVFIQTINFDKINTFGFYGGEVAVNTDGYQQIFDMLPSYKRKWCFTNGAWSQKESNTNQFINFALDNNLNPVIVSGTSEHKKFQNTQTLNELKEKFNIFVLKGQNENFIPMGRLSPKKFVFQDLKCSFKCETNKNPIRLCVIPSGNIIYQTCDGSYPIIGNYTEDFETIWKRAINFNRGVCMQCVRAF